MYIRSQNNRKVYVKMKTTDYKAKYEIHNYHTDFKGLLTIPALINFMQHAAGEHAAENGLGYSQMIAQKRAWVLSRMRIRFTQRFKWNDLLHLTTWVHNAGKLFSHRHFELSDASGRVQGVGATDWALLDLKTRRPMILDEYIGQIPIIPERAAFDKPIGKVHKTEFGNAVYSHKVRFSDLDVNKHVNNVKYLEWMMNAFDFAFHEKHNVMDITLNYKAEAFYGSCVNVYVSELDDTKYVVLLRESETEKEICSAEIVFSV